MLSFFASGKVITKHEFFMIEYFSLHAHICLINAFFDTKKSDATQLSLRAVAENEMGKLLANYQNKDRTFSRAI